MDWKLCHSDKQKNKKVQDIHTDKHISPFKINTHLMKMEVIMFLIITPTEAVSLVPLNRFFSICFQKLTHIWPVQM